MSWSTSFRGGVFAFILSVILATKLEADAPLDPGLLLLESFSSSCASRGVFSQRTLNETTALKRIIESLKDDQACRGLNPIFTSLIHLNSQLDFLQNGFEGDRESDLNNYLNRLSYAIHQRNIEAFQDRLSSEYAQALVEQVTLSRTQKQEARHQLHRAVNDLGSYLESIQKDFADQQLCFQNHKSLPIQLAGHLLSLSGAFFDPTLNLALSLSGRLIATAFSFFSDLKFNKKIKDYESTTLQAGLGCAMEALEQTVCDIQDRRNLISVVQDYRKEPTIPAAWIGYDIYVRDFQIFRDFVLKVEAGSPASSDQQADRRAEFRKSEGEFNAMIESISGHIGEAKTELAFPGQTREDKKNIIRSLIDSVATLLSHNSLMEKVVPDGFASANLWLRIGDPRPIEEKIDAGGAKTFKDNYTILDELNKETSIFQPKDAVSNLMISSVETRLEAILTAARARLALERELRLITDPQGALNSWSQKGVNGVSAELVSARILDYLRSLETEWGNHSEWFDSMGSKRDQIALCRDTRERFEALVSIMEKVKVIVKNPDSETDESKNDENEKEEGGVVKTERKKIYSDKLQEIYRAMNLQEKDQFISDRIYQLVTMDLEKRLRSGSLQSRESLENIVKLSQERLLTALNPSASSRLEPLKEDLDNAEPYALSNIFHFFKHYRSSFAEVLESMDQLAKVFKQKPNGSIYRKMAKLCVLALNDPEILTDKRLVAACEGRVLGLAEDNGPVLDMNGRPIQVVFRAADIAFQKPEERLCAYRRFRNRLELQEDILRHRPKSTSIMALQSFSMRPPFTILYDEFPSKDDLKFSYSPF